MRYVPGITLNMSNAYIQFPELHEVGAIIILVLEIRNLRHSEVK